MYTGHTRAASNRADLVFDIEVKNPDGTFADFTGATIRVSLRLTTHGTPTLVGTNQDGHIVVTGPGIARVRFTRAEMTPLPAGDLDIAITVLMADGITHQLLAGQMPIIDGIEAA